MILRCGVVVLSLVLGLAIGPSTPTVLAQSLTEVRSAVQEYSSTDIEGFRVVTTRVAREGRTSERSVTEGPSINGGSTVLSAGRGPGDSDRSRSNPPYPTRIRH